MNLTIYAKKHHSANGSDFYVYLTKLKTKTGEELTARVRFTKECEIPTPDACPLNVSVDKTHASLTKSTYKPEGSGTEIPQYVLWVRKWTPGEPFEDHSLDDIAE